MSICTGQLAKVPPWIDSTTVPCTASPMITMTIVLTGNSCQIISNLDFPDSAFPWCVYHGSESRIVPTWLALVSVSENSLEHQNWSLKYLWATEPKWILFILLLHRYINTDYVALCFINQYLTINMLHSIIFLVKKCHPKVLNDCIMVMGCIRIRKSTFPLSAPGWSKYEVWRRTTARKCI